jgi:hypothetical protein
MGRRCIGLSSEAPVNVSEPSPDDISPPEHSIAVGTNSQTASGSPGTADPKTQAEHLRDDRLDAGQVCDELARAKDGVCEHQARRA